MPLCGDEQVGLDGVEKDALDQTLGLAERHLGPPLGQLVNQHSTIGTIRTNCGEVITLRVPSDLE